MTQAPRIGIVGAGVTGLTCAAALQAHGYRVVVLEKSRGIGGRMATRRRDGLQFDHGAPFIALPGGDRQHALFSPGKNVTAWPSDDAAQHRFVGVPGMSDLCRPLADGLDIRFQQEITGLRRAGAQWSIRSADAEHIFDAVVLTIPAPQVGRIESDLDPDVTDALAPVVFDPCFALMAAFETRPDWPEVMTDPGAPFSLILRDSAKPDRPSDAECWVAHATADWSREHLELERPDAAKALLEALAAVMGPLPPVRLALGHRWRFSRAARPLGRDVLSNADETVFLGGDWSRGRTVNDALHVGDTLAKAVLARPGGTKAQR